MGNLRAILLIICVFITAVSQAQTVRVTWIGQACFYVQTDGGPTVVVDPPAESNGYPLPVTPADVVSISHTHGDHSNSAGVRGTFTLVDGRPTTTRSEMTAAGLPFVLIPGFHDTTNGSARGRNTIVRWTQGGLNFAHFGDYGQASLTSDQIADLRNLDVLMVPAGGSLTIGSPEIAAIIEQLTPRVTILMHYRTAFGGQAQFASTAALATAFPSIRYKPASVALTRATVPSSPEVWLMEPAADTVAVNAAGFTPGAPLAPSALGSVFGNFAGSATAAYTSVPLPRKLGETEVFLGTEAVPLLYVSPTQVNFQMPGALAPGQNVVEVRVAGQRVGRGAITTVARSPGLFALIDQESRMGRGRRGGTIRIYGSGQGAVAPPAADGVAAANPRPVAAEPAVFIGPRRLTVTSSALTPGAVGLWEIDAQIPQDLATGNAGLVVLFDVNLLSNILSIAID